MKKLIPFFLALMFIFVLPSPALQAQEFADAGAYMDYISSERPKFQEDLWSYIKASSHGKKESKVEALRVGLINTTKNISRKAKRYPGYENDFSLRDSIASYYELCYNILNEDYAKVVDLEKIAEESYDLMEAYLTAKEVADKKLDQAASRFEVQQEVFAKAHNVTLVEGEKDKTTANLEVAGKVFDYYNEIYLIFFKNYKQEVYLLDAMSKADVSAIVQNQNALKKASAEGLEKLAAIQPYNGDASVVEACKKMLAFHQDEATNKIKTNVDYLLKKEKFEKIKAAMDAKKQNQRTQADVDTFNKAVGEFNDAVNASNQTNDELNKEREQVFKGWNKAVDKFMDRHVP